MSDRIKTKWERIGEELKIPDLELLYAPDISPEECYSNIIESWKNTKCVPYTWNVFFEVLSVIGDGDIAQELKGIYVTCVFQLNLFSFRSLWHSK